ncbi:hypothetical protein [Frigoribacterium sp. PvP032]|uniref:hypothetical protein n=1 Tax=Frigoribacterium sp. PvP032 TaxID=2806589 RepID=UPI001AE24805|nr:hypothetical protein [Frigoribacterium sp. PvP032]MBP1189725.1 hypothetical protein [Frigoribacterium sp. PvP032]
MDARRQRMLRAALSAGVSTLVTAAAHALGGGTFPPALLLGTAVVVSVLLCFALGGRRVTLPRLVVAVAATQGLLHAVFTLAGGMAPMADDQPAGGAGGAHAGHHLPGATAVLPELAAGAHDGSMVGAHVVAGLVTIASLRAGTSAVRQLVRALRLVLVRLVARVVALVVPHRPRGAVRVERAPRPLVTLLLATTRALRGPPAPATT